MGDDLETFLNNLFWIVILFAHVWGELVKNKVQGLDARATNLRKIMYFYIRYVKAHLRDKNYYANKAQILLRVITFAIP